MITTLSMTTPLDPVGVSNVWIKPTRMNWEGLYTICAENNVAYQGVAVEFRWREFRKRDAVWVSLFFYFRRYGH